MRWFIGVIVVSALLISGLAWFGARNSKGESTTPPDWPVRDLSVPAGATELHFDPSLRSPLGAGREVLERVDRQAGTHSTQYYSIAFNTELSMPQVFAHFEQQLLAAGYSAQGGRDEALLEQTGLADRVYFSPDGKWRVLVRFWKDAMISYGGKERPQHWTITISPS